LVIGDITVHGSTAGSGELSDDTYDEEQRSKKGRRDGSSLWAVKCMIATAIEEEDGMLLKADSSFWFVDSDSRHGNERQEVSRAKYTQQSRR
jgi:hypothetical protein